MKKWKWALLICLALLLPWETALAAPESGRAVTNARPAAMLLDVGKTIDHLRLVPPENDRILEGLSLDVTGLEVYAVFQDGTEEELLDYTLSGFRSTPGEQTVTVSYEDAGGTVWKESFSVTVEPTEEYVSGLMVPVKPKREYVQGESLDLSRMMVWAFYPSTAYKDVTASVVVTGYDPRKTGRQALTISYGGKSTQISVYVKPASVPTDSPVPTGTPVDVAAPRISVKSMQGGKKVSLDQADSADIYYTTDGTVPTEQARLYSGEELVLDETTTIKAVAIDDGKSSRVTSGIIRVGRTERPVASHESGELIAGTLITLRCATSGASIYYTVDGSAPSFDGGRYAGSILVDRSMTIRAVAVKDGCQASEQFRVSYTVPHEETRRDSVTIAAGNGDSMAGDNVSISVSIYTEDEETAVEGFRFTMNYDPDVLVYDSVDSVADHDTASLFAATREGTVSVQWTQDKDMGEEALASGEMCTLTFRVLASALDGDYDLTLDNDARRLSITTSTGRETEIETFDGKVTLSGSHNSQLTATVGFFSEGDHEIRDVSDLSPNEEIAASITVEEESARMYQEQTDGPLTVNAFLAIYDRSGMLASLDTWEIDLSDMEHLSFMNRVRIPLNVRVGRVKVMVMSEEMTPLIIAGALGGS